MIDLIKRPVLTEKSTRLLENNQYMFDVDPRLTKTKVRELIKELFDVTILSVNSHNSPRKKRRLGQYQGYRPRYKRVIVTLKAGDSISLFPEA